MAQIVRISITPVKAFALVHPDEVMLEAGGVVGNRRFWLRDEQGALYAGKRNGDLQRVRADWDESSRRLALTFPDGRHVDGVVQLGEPVATELYRRPRPSHRVIGPWQEAISQYAGRDLELLWADNGAVDRATWGGSVSLVSRASLDKLGDEAGVKDVDGRRFRMLFEIDGVGAHEEDEWMNRRVRVGDAVIEVNGDIGRCIVTSRDPDTGVVDLPTLVTLAAYRREGVVEQLPFGVYGSVVEPGRVRIGDIARPL